MDHEATGPARIGLLGGECSGKSTLAGLLAQRLPACRVDEALREFTATMGRPPMRDEQPRVMAAQVAREEAAARACPHGTLVADPATLMTAVYSVLYFDDDSLLAEASAHVQAYDLLVWCAPDIPWVPDPGQRDGAALRDRADRIIAGLVDGGTLHGVPVLRVSGSPDERVTAVTRAWQPRGPGTPT